MISQLPSFHQSYVLFIRKIKNVSFLLPQLFKHFNFNLIILTWCFYPFTYVLRVRLAMGTSLFGHFTCVYCVGLTLKKRSHPKQSLRPPDALLNNTKCNVMGSNDRSTLSISLVMHIFFPKRRWNHPAREIMLLIGLQLIITHWCGI